MASLRTGRVMNACVGPITAGPFRTVGLDPVVPDRYRLGALIRIVTDNLIDDNARSIETELGPLVIRGGAAVLDGTVLPLGPGPRAVLAALVAAGGDVVSTTGAAGGAARGGGRPRGRGDGEPAAHRDRPPELVRTVVRRGYRLAVVEPAPESQVVPG